MVDEDAFNIIIFNLNYYILDEKIKSSYVDASSIIYDQNGNEKSKIEEIQNIYYQDGALINKINSKTML